MAMIAWVPTARERRHGRRRAGRPGWRSGRAARHTLRQRDAADDGRDRREPGQKRTGHAPTGRASASPPSRVCLLLPTDHRHGRRAAPKPAHAPLVPLDIVRREIGHDRRQHRADDRRTPVDPKQGHERDPGDEYLHRQVA
jgi:hypothetical protein